MNGYSDDINHAFAFATKYRAPYAPAEGAMSFVAHPANVAVILARHSADEVTLVAAILHHVLEVAPPREHPALWFKIEDKFGVGVLLLAREACECRQDDRGDAIPWIHRKRNLLHQLLTMPPRALDICCADQIHECGTALALTERLGREYLHPYGLPANAPDLGYYDDILTGFDRRVDWHARGMKQELQALKRRLAVTLGLRG